MAQRYDIVRIDFQANAGKANAAIESLRKTADGCNTEIQKLKKTLKEQISNNATDKEIANTRTLIAEQQKLYKVYDRGYKELIKGMRTLDEAVKHFNDGTLAEQSAAFQKAAFNAAKLVRERTPKKEELDKWRQLTAIMDATQQNYARLQGDTQMVLETLRKGGKVSASALNEELKAQRELLSVMSETDKGYKQTQRNVAELDLYLKKMGGNYEFIRQNITDTKKVSDEMLRNMYTELEKVNQEGKVTQKIMQENATTMKEIRAEQARRVENVLGGNLGQQSEQGIRTAIVNAKELLATYKTSSKEAQTLSAQIVNAEEHLKTHGIEAARAAQRETQQIQTQEQAEKQLQATMNKRLRSLSTLSAEALAETRKYWEAQAAGADRGSAELKKYEANLQKIIRQERERKVAQLDGVLKNPSGYGIAEVRNAVAEMEKLRDSVAKTHPMWAHFNKLVEQGKTYLDQLAKTEAAQKIASQMQNLTTLSAQGLQEVKQYWETMVAGAEKGSSELSEYEEQLKRVTTEESERKQLALESASQSITTDKPHFFAMSETEIRKAIDATRQLQQAVEFGGEEYDKYSRSIINAEEHLKEYGIEGERAWQKQLEAIRRYEGQLYGEQKLSANALKTQEQDWRRLIDDPATASDYLQRYEQNLHRVHTLQQQMAEEQVSFQGWQAVNFFRNQNGEMDNASADQIKQQADALKKFRDSLPQQANAILIEEIDGLIRQTGEAAKVAAGEMMTLADAEALAGQLGTKGFTASTDKLKLAKKALEEAQTAAGRGSARFTELQDKINKVDLELAKTGEIAENVRQVLDKPQGQSLNALKQAVEQGNAALKNMDRTTKEGQKDFDRLAQQVKTAEAELKKLAGTSKATAGTFEKAWSRLKTYVGLYVSAAVAMQKIVATMGDLMELSDRMGEVRKTTGFTADEVGRLTTALSKMDTRTPITGLMELSAAAGQLGLKTEQDVKGFTEAANMLMVALPEMGKEGATAMMKVALATGEIDKIREQMQQGLIDGSDAVSVAMTKIGSTIDALRANSAAAAPAITDFVKRVGAVGAQSGITIDQVAALGSTVDALGMRVEMSATALSRMIPAIKNNAFNVANILGVTPETVRNLFDAGRGMEVILMILQHIKDANLDEDGIESLLGQGGMGDLMKTLNQQGARAGIVFAGLSQNVDELRRQLVVARNAYADNIAIQEEYNKMNDTTAAKWERLKNQIEETFVGDNGQGALGWVIDQLRTIVDLLTGDNGVSAGIRSVILAIGLLKLNIAGGLTNAVKKLYATVKSMSWVGWANLISSVALALGYLGMQMGWFKKKTDAVTTSVGNLAEQLQEENARLEQTFRSFSKYNAELDNAKKKLEEVQKANKDTAAAETALQKAQEKHDASIREINSKYGTYLGYMLSETASAEQLAKARELINAKLREAITLKQKEAALGDVEQDYGGGVRKAASGVDMKVRKYFGDNYDAAARVSIAISEAAEKYSKNADMFRAAVREAVKAEQKYFDQEKVTELKVQAQQRGMAGNMDNVAFLVSQYVNAAADDLRKAVANYNEQVDITLRTYEARDKVNRKKSRKAAIASLKAIKKDWEDLLAQYQKAEGEEREKLAVEVYKQQRAYANEFANNSDYFTVNTGQKSIENTIENMKSYEKGLREVADEAIKTVDAAERAESIIKNMDFMNGGESENNPWGNGLPADSTDWAKMTADQLVARRKQMNDFVKALQEDTDVASVLKEDAALKSAIEKGMSSDMRTVIEWYDAERLKIQDELYKRHLTNTGDWQDPKKESVRKKKIREEWMAYLNELDAYYTERQAEIQKAQTEEGLSEAEAQRQIVENEEIWRQRRMELMKLYANKSVEVTAEEQQAIFDIIAGRTKDTATYVKKSIQQTVDFSLALRDGDHNSRVEYDALMGWLDKGIEQDFLKQRNALAKQLNAIRDIIARERPYDGLVDNLRDNLETMGILNAELDRKRLDAAKAGKEPEDDTKQRVQQSIERTAFLLEQAEDAYSLTVEEMMKRIADKGMTAWADELENNHDMQDALLAQLRNTYDEIQNAVKKEASMWKKQAEIMWNNILLPDGVTTLKQVADKVSAQLSLDNNRVSRANSLIGAGPASSRVADKLAIKQLQIQMSMQEHYFNLMHKRGQATIDNLDAQIERAKQLNNLVKAEKLEHQKKYAQMALNLATSKEETELAKQREEIVSRTEDSYNRMYTAMREYADVLYSALQGVFEASHAGASEFYNERAKLRLTGVTGGAQQYIVTENAGTSGATAHYEYLDAMQAAERQYEIERKNAQANAWKKMMDDIAEQMNKVITDQLNAILQNASIDANTQALDGVQTALMNEQIAEANNTSALGLNTEALQILSGKITALGGKGTTPSVEFGPFDRHGVIGDDEGAEEGGAKLPRALAKRMGLPVSDDPYNYTNMDPSANPSSTVQAKMAADDAYTEHFVQNANKRQNAETRTDKKSGESTQSMFAKMTIASNMYGIAYQAMANDNMSVTQKFASMAIQSAGNAAITMLNVEMSKAAAKAATDSPGVLGTLWKQLGWAAAPVFAIFTGLLGGLMGLAASKISKSKSEIASATGTGSSVASGRLATGMLTYAEGNVNEFTNPDSLTPGRQYNVDAADGRTYRARYMGRNPRTHITNGPEFHLSGERGREAIIDARTTRHIQMNESGIWQAIKTLSSGGSLHGYHPRRGGMRSFAEGNIDEFEYGTQGGGMAGMSAEQLKSLQDSIDRQSELLDRALTHGIKGVFDVYGRGGLVDSYDTGKREAMRHGQRY